MISSRHLSTSSLTNALIASEYASSLEQMSRLCAVMLCRISSRMARTTGALAADSIALVQCEGDMHSSPMRTHCWPSTTVPSSRRSTVRASQYSPVSGVPNGSEYVIRMLYLLCAFEYAISAFIASCVCSALPAHAGVCVSSIAIMGWRLQ